MHILDYYQPSSLNEALEYLNTNTSKTKILAGGTDLIIKIREKSMEAEYILDLSKVHQLKGIRKDNNSLIIGSMVSFDEIKSNQLVNEYIPILAKAAGTVGSPQIRNTATIGGNIVNAAPAADSIPALLALGAKVKLKKFGSEMEVPLENILVGVNNTSIMPDQILTEIIIPIPSSRTKMIFIKLGRRKAVTIARFNMGITLTLDENWKIESTSVAIGAVGLTAYRVLQVEKFLLGKALDEDCISAACGIISDVVAQKLGTRPTAPYKKAIARASLHKALTVIKTEMEEESK